MKRSPNLSASVTYIEEIFAQETAYLRSVRTSCDVRGWSMHIDPHEGKLLSMLITLHQPHTIIEIGTLGAYSTLWMASSLPKDAHIHTVEIDPEKAQLAQRHIDMSGFAEHITLWQGDAAEILPQKLTSFAPFDMLFIDANKSAYWDYVQSAEPYLSDNAMIILDNAFLFGATYKEELPKGVTQTSCNKMKACHNHLAHSGLYHTTMIPTEQGMLVAIKRAL